MTRTLCFLACLLLWLPPAHAGNVYKWKDANGVTRYTDLPPPDKIPYQTISRKKPAAPVEEAATDEEAGSAEDAAAPGEGSAEASPDDAGPAPAKAPAAAKSSPAPAAQGANGDDKELAAAKKKIADAEAKKKKAQEEEDRKLREKNCAAAKANLIQLKQGGRIYSTNEKGEREYLSDADYDKNVAQAQSDVDQWCGSQ